MYGTIEFFVFIGIAAQNGQTTVILICMALDATGEKVRKLIEEKESELALLQRDIATLKSLILPTEPKSRIGQPYKRKLQFSPVSGLGDDSNAGMAQRFLKSAGTPLKVNDLVKMICEERKDGENNSPKVVKAALSSTVSKLILKDRYFVRISEGVYGLKGRDEHLKEGGS